MALIDPDNPAATGTTKSYWQDQLKNKRILAFEIDKAILVLSRQERESYTFDTGQTTMTVRRVNLPNLISQLPLLRKEIQEIEILLENMSGGSFIQVVPF